MRQTENSWSDGVPLTNCQVREVRSNSVGSQSTRGNEDIERNRVQVDGILSRSLDTRPNPVVKSYEFDSSLAFFIMWELKRRFRWKPETGGGSWFDANWISEASREKNLIWPDECFSPFLRFLLMIMNYFWFFSRNFTLALSHGPKAMTADTAAVF